MSAARTLEVFAPAKINLALHVTGQRADGYHLLDSLVVFADVGDVLTVRTQVDAPLTLSGCFAANLEGAASNLVEDVAAAFGPLSEPVSFHLCKDLPVTSGIGGGSADAGACYRALRALRGAQGEPDALPPEDMERLLDIGADVPVCALSRSGFVRGIGDELEPVDGLPPLFAVLVNPLVPVSTPRVFAALADKYNAPLACLPAGLDSAGLIGWLSGQRNDLQGPAVHSEPVIGDVLAVLGATEGCHLARMSGSGATCFGLFPTREAAERAATDLGSAHPGWWARAATLAGTDSTALQTMRSTT